MAKPKVSLENYEAVYEHYASIDPSATALKALHWFSRFIYYPHTQFEAGAEQGLEQQLSSGTRLLIASNHLVMFDQFPVAAAMQKEEVFKPVIGNTFVPAKAPYFKKPYLRPALDYLGAVPVIRKQDVEGVGMTYASATKAFIELCANKIEDGYHMFIFPEGTRKKEGNGESVQVLKGIGRIAAQASKRDVPVAILPMGLWFGNEPKRFDWVKPELFVGKPIPGPFEDYRAATTPLSDALTYCVNMAIANSVRNSH